MSFMHLKNSLITALLLFIGFATVDNANGQDLLSWQDIMDHEVEEQHLRFQVGPDSLQFGDLWLPDKRGPHPVVILIHGGCWLGQYPGVALTNPMAEALMNAGFAVWNIEYRRIGHDGGGYPGTFLDVANAADYLRKFSETYRLNFDTIIAAGHSAGGHLATWLAARENIPSDSPLYIENPIAINKVISLAGINDLKHYAEYGSSPCGENSVEQLVNLTERGDSAYEDTSPSNLLPFSADHTEIVASFDSPVPPFFGKRFVDQVTELGGKATLVLLPEAGHYEMIAPWSEEWEKVLNIFTQQ